MSNWKSEMYERIAEYLREEKALDIVEVTSIDEDVSVRGPYGCDTCGPEYDTEFELYVYYIDSAGKRQSTYYDGGFFSLINAIT